MISLSESLKICEAATEGPWEQGTDIIRAAGPDRIIKTMSPNENEISVIVRVRTSQSLIETRGEIDDKNFAFICHSRTALPESLRLLSEAREVLIHNEWLYDSITQKYHCPECANDHEEGHREDCKWAKFLKEVGE